MENNARKHEDTAAHWIAQRDRGDWTSADEAGLAAWVNENPSHRVAYLRMQKAWAEASKLKALGAGVPLRTVPERGRWQFSRFYGLPLAQWQEKLPRAPARRRMQALAAGIAIVTVLILGGYWRADPETFRTAVGGSATVPLPDGSKIVMNTDSEVRLALTSTERLVDLERGEAFFEVSKDPTRPFIVRAGNKRIVAVGTAFAVRRESDDVQVWVTEGSVRLQTASSLTGEIRETGAALLVAGAIAHARRHEVQVQKKPVGELDQALSWRSGFLIFRETPLADAVAEFNRYNERKFVIDDPALAAIPIGGNFRATNVEAFARLLEEGFAIRSRAAGDRIVLTSR